MKYEIGDKLRVTNIAPLLGNKIAPNLDREKEYKIKEIILDSMGNQHLDVGLPSEYNYITSYETKEELQRGDIIHWCHPSRFERI